MKYAFLFILLLLLLTQVMAAQIPTYQFILKNDTLVNNTAYEFDIYILRTGITSLELAGLQAIMTFNTAITSGALTLTINSGSSQLNVVQQPTNAKLSIVGNELRMAPNSPPGSGNGTIIPTTPGVRVGRFRLTSTVPFSNKSSNIIWKNSGAGFITDVTAYVSTINTVITDSTGHLNQLLNGSLSPLTITTTSPLPSANSGIGFFDTLQASGGTQPYIWNLTSGSLPVGLTLSSAGIISGTSTISGTYNFTARVTDSVLTVTTKAFSITVNPGALNNFLVEAQAGGPIGVQTAAVPFNIKITARDTNNNTVTSFTGTVDITSNGTLSAGSGTTPPFVGGILSSRSVTTNISGINRTLTATRTGGSEFGTSNTFTVNPGSASRLTIQTQPSATATAGTPFAIQPVIRIEDANGNLVSSDNTTIVTAARNLGTGILQGTLSATASGGIATFTNLSYTKAETLSINFTSGILTSSTSNNIIVSSGAAIKIRVETASNGNGTIVPLQSIASSSSLTGYAITRDVFDNFVTNAAATWSILNSTGGIVGSDLVPSPDSKSAVFTAHLVGTTQIKATAGLLDSVSSGIITVIPGPASKLVFVQQPTNTVAGKVISPSVTIQLKDTFNNNVASAGNSINATLLGTGILSGTSPRLTDVTGLATFNDLSINQAGPKRLIAASTGLALDTSVTFTLSTDTITATSGPNGTISPSGIVNVTYGANQTFTMTPNTGYHVDSILVDGGYVGNGTIYTFTNVITNHTISVKFAINVYTITATASANGSISPLGLVNVNYGGSQSFTITPNTGYHVDSVVVDGINQGAITIYPFNSVTSNHTISAYFSINIFTITASAGAHGSISPSGAVAVTYGSTQKFSIQPNTGYHVDSVKVDGSPVVTDTTYTFTNIIANHTITASFAPNVLSITVQTNPDSLSYIIDGVTYIGTRIFTWIVAQNHTISTDSIQSGTTGKRYAWNSWTNASTRSATVSPLVNTTYTANFKTQYYLTMVANPGGTVAPPSGWFNSGDTVTITAIPQSNFYFNVWSGSPSGSGQYSGSSNPAKVIINAPITETASFKQNQIHITVQTNPDGRSFSYDGATYTLKQTVTVDPGTLHYLNVVTPQQIGIGAQYTWASWSDSGAAYHTVTPITDTTYTANFTKQFYLTTSAGTGGTVSPSASWLDSGKIVNIKAKPNTGYIFKGWTGSGTGSYTGAIDSTFITMSSPITETAAFAIDTVIITANAGTGGTISPTGAVKVPYGSSQVFTITPDSSYHVSDVVVDGISIGARTSYTFSNVISSHTIIASFTINGYSITATAGLHGSISPSGSVSVTSGASQTFSIRPNSGYHVDSIKVDGVFAGRDTTYTFTNITSNHTITVSFAPNFLTITVHTNPDSLLVTVDDTTYTSPHQFAWLTGSNHTIAAVDSQVIGIQARFIFARWSDVGARRHSVVPLGDTSFTAIYSRQYFLTMSADTGGTVTPPSSWQDSGRTISISATPTMGYKFSRWQGTGIGSYSDTSNPAFITINSPITETAKFIHFPVGVTIQTNPVGLSIIIDDSVYTSPHTFTWTTGSNHSIATVDTQMGSVGTRYLWSNWNDGGARSHIISPSRDTTFTAVFTAQYFLTMNANIGGTVSPSNGWFNAGQSVQIQAYPSGIYNFSRWSGIGNGSKSTTNNPETITMNSPITETASFAKKDIQITIGTNPPGLNFGYNGRAYSTEQTATVNPSDVTQNVDIYNTIQPGSSAGIQYAWTHWSDGGAKYHFLALPDSNTTYTAFFKTQFQLNTSAGVGGIVSPTTSWQDSGNIVTIKAIPNQGYIFKGWVGSGIGSYTGLNDSATITILNPITEVAAFAIDTLTIIASANGQGTISPSGAVKFNYGSNQTFTIVPDTGYHIDSVVVDGVNKGALTNYTFISVTTSHTISAFFSINMFTITATAGLHGTISPSGFVPVAYGSNQKFNIRPNTGYHVDTVKVDGSLVGSDTTYTFTNIKANHTITTTFASDFLSITMRTNPDSLLISVDGITYTSPYQFAWASGSNHTIAVVDTQAGKTGTRFVWNSWNDGGARTHIVAPQRDTTFTAIFTTQYYLTMNANTGGTVTPASGWNNKGQTVTITAIPNNKFNFNGWSGSGSGSYSGSNNPASITMNGPITETANFNPKSIRITVSTYPAGRYFIFDGRTYNTEQTQTIDPGTQHFLGITSPQPDTLPNVQYAWSSWSDSGDQSHSVFPTTDTTFVANLKLQYALTVNILPNISGTTTPSGRRYFNAGDTVTLTATPNHGYAFTNWSGDFSSFNNPALIIIDRPKSVTANFAAGVQVTIASNPQGRRIVVDDSMYTSPKIFNWLRGSTHSITTTSPQTDSAGTQYLWNNWSDGGLISHTIAPSIDTIITASFSTQYFLTMGAGIGGTVTPASGWYQKGQTISIMAIPDTHYVFTNWVSTGGGAYTGTNNPATITMNSPITELASFVWLLPPPTATGLPDNAVDVPTNPTLSWMIYSGASSYGLQVSTDSTFTDTTQYVYNGSGIADTLIQLTSIANSKTFYWHVNAKVGASISRYSPTKKFTTLSATIVVTTPSSSWATGYNYEIRWLSNYLSGGVNIKLTIDSGKSFLALKSNLTNSGLTTWKVPDSLTTHVIDSCKIIVESYLNNAIFGISNIFSIVPGTLPKTVSIKNISIPFPIAPISTDYRLISAPGLVDTIKFGYLLSGTHKIEWRVFEDNGATENYLTELGSTSSLKTGEGYWMLKKQNLDIPDFTMVMPTLNSDAAYSYQLHAGWNIIGNPFDKNISWQSVLDVNNLPFSTQLLGYNGSYISTTSIEPFKGYYFFNSTNLTSLKFPYPFGRINTRHLTTPVDWKVQLSFESDINKDPENYIGIAPTTKLGMNELNGHKPPLFLDQGFLYFSRPEWDEKYQKFNSDFRSTLGEGQVWEFEISSPRKSKGTINFGGIEQIPSEYQVVLINTLNSAPVDLRKQPHYSFEIITAKTPFKLVVGKKNFVEQEISKLMPETFELVQNYPNPFNSSTVISIKLPYETNVSLEIYSILGQRIRTLADGHYQRGIYTFNWEGTDFTGMPVASGVYFYRLIDGGKQIQTKKMIITK